MRIQRGGRGVRAKPLKNHKNIGVSSDTGPIPQKNRSYQASIQCSSIIGTPAKRHPMAFRWRADDGPLIVVLGSSLPSSTKKKKKKKKKHVVKVGPPSDKTFGIRALHIEQPSYSLSGSRIIHNLNLVHQCSSTTKK